MQVELGPDVVALEVAVVEEATIVEVELDEAAVAVASKATVATA